MEPRDAAKTFFTLREKLLTEPATLVTIVTAVATIYGYVYGYEYRLGTLAAYKIPASYAHVDIPLVIQSTFQAVGALLLLFVVALALVKRMAGIKLSHRRYFVGTFICVLFLYLTIKYLFSNQSVWSAVTMPTFLFVLGIVTLYTVFAEFRILYEHLRGRYKVRPANVTDTDSSIISESKQDTAGTSLPSKTDLTAPMTKLQFFLFLIFFLVVVIPGIAYHVGYREARRSDFYSTIINQNKKTSYAIVTSGEDLTFALSYKDSTFSDTVLVLNSGRLDTLKLKRKYLIFNDTTSSAYQRLIDKGLHWLHTDFMNQ